MALSAYLYAIMPSVKVSSSQLSYQELEQIAVNNIKKLPPIELRYYLVLFIAAIQNEQKPEKYMLLLDDLNDLVLAIDNFYKNREPKTIAAHLAWVAACLNTLVDDAKTHTLARKLQKIILNICAGITAIVLGAIGAVVGLSLGLFSQGDFVKGAYLGFLSGLAIGLIIGFRIPGKVFVDDLTAKLQYVLDSIKKITLELDDGSFNPVALQKTDNDPYFVAAYSADENAIKQSIISKFFGDENYPTIEAKEAAFSHFLQSTAQTFEICTTQNGFLDRRLKGNLGNHTLIRYKINNIEALPIEFGPRNRYPHWVDQHETRVVTGQKLFDMIVLDRQLQKTHVANLRFVWTSFQVGDNDCLTYTNKILIGTQQSPAKVQRFSSAIDSWVGDKIVGKLFKFFSKTSEQELDAIRCDFDDGNHSMVCTHIRGKV